MDLVSCRSHLHCNRAILERDPVRSSMGTLRGVQTAMHGFFRHFQSYSQRLENAETTGIPASSICRKEAIGS